MCSSNTLPTKIASRDKKRCNASVHGTRLVHESSSRYANQHRKCNGSLFSSLVPTLQPHRLAAKRNSTVHNVNDFGSQKQACQNLPVLLTMKGWDFTWSHSRWVSFLFFFCPWITVIDLYQWWQQLTVFLSLISPTPSCRGSQVH